MAYLPNPYYGIVPGAPQALNFWTGPQFNMSGLPPPLPPPPPPPPPLSPTVTPQDLAVRGVLSPDTGGAQPGGGGPGSGPGGLGGASGGGRDTTTSGYQGVYAQSPVDINSQFGTGLGLAGMGVPFPGAGTVLGAAGNAIDAARYNGTLAQNGLPGNVSVPASMGYGLLSSIGIPFTDINLATAFGVRSPRERMADIIAGLPPGLYNEQGYGAIAANAPHSPGAPFGNTGWGPGMNPTTSQYPPGFFENEARLAIAANPDIFGSTAKGTFDLGAYGTAQATKGGPPAESRGTAADKEAGATAAAADKAAAQADWGGGNYGSAADPSGGGAKGDTSPSPGGSGDTSREGGSDAYKYRGGLIGAPPGRYAAGGTVGRAGGEAEFQSWIRALPWFHEFVQQYGEEPNLRDPDYNYRRAHRAGIEPERYAPDANRYHWPSVTPEGDELKGPNHPTRWMEDFMQQHGRDPNEMDAPFQQGVTPGAYAAGGAVRAAGRMPTRSEAEFIPIVPRDFMSDFQPGWDEYFPGGGRRDAAPDASGHLPAREQMIEDAMRGYGIGRNREGYPEGFAAGGQVPPTPGDNITPQQFGALRGINPPGPDDQIGALQTGEGVLTKRAMAAYPGLLDAANAGTLDPGRVKGLLAPAIAKPRRVR